MANASDREKYNELAYDTLAHADPAFIHQHVVDAFAAQTADARSKPIKVAFALIGLYLHLEKGMSGRNVQRMHMRLAKQRKFWPTFTLPADRGSMTAADVLVVPPGPERDAAIERWCASVWEAYAGIRNEIVALVENELR